MFQREVLRVSAPIFSKDGRAASLCETTGDREVFNLRDGRGPSWVAWATWTFETFDLRERYLHVVYIFLDTCAK